MRRMAIENHVLERHKLEFILNSNSGQPYTDREGKTIAMSTAPFISTTQTADASQEDSYIVIYADEDELESSKEMQVTILAEDGMPAEVRLLFTDSVTLF